MMTLVDTLLVGYVQVLMDMHMKQHSRFIKEKDIFRYIFCGLEWCKSWRGIVTGFLDVMNAGVGWCVTGGLCTYFFGDGDLITLGIDKVIKLCISDIYFKGCNDVKLEDLVTGVKYGFNDGVGWCVAGVMVTYFDGHIFWWRFRCNKNWAW